MLISWEESFAYLRSTLRLSLSTIRAKFTIRVYVDLQPLSLESLFHDPGKHRSGTDYYKKHLFTRVLSHSLNKDGGEAISWNEPLVHRRLNSNWETKSRPHPSTQSKISLVLLGSRQNFPTTRVEGLKPTDRSGSMTMSWTHDFTRVTARSMSPTHACFYHPGLYAYPYPFPETRVQDRQERPQAHELGD